MPKKGRWFKKSKKASLSQYVMDDRFKIMLKQIFKIGTYISHIYIIQIPRTRRRPSSRGRVKVSTLKIILLSLPGKKL